MKWEELIVLILVLELIHLFPFLHYREINILNFTSESCASTDDI